MKNAKICIIGAEAWGSAIATAVGKNVLKGDFDARVHIYVYDELVRHNYLSEVMNDQQENIKYLPGIQLPKNLIAVNDLLEAAENADILIFATPQSFVKSYCNILEGKIKSTAFAVSMTKGLDHIKDGEIELYSQAISKQLKIPCYSMMCANSAMEMAQGKLCEITIGCNNAERARVMTTVFQTDNCKVVATDDVHGVELCGTLKDIIALGAGFIDGLRLGDNARVAALHLGLKEMMRFVKTFYPTAKMSTFFESCGVANSVASSYADKNVTFAKNFVTSGKTLQEIEGNLLKGRKLLGPVLAQQVNEVLKKRNMLDKFPLFSTIHKICENKVHPMEIVEVLRNHPDLSTSSISDLLDEEHHMALKNATELMLGNEVEMEPLPTFSVEQILVDSGATEKECITFSEKQEDWSPVYQYFTAKEADRITQAIMNSAPFEEPFPLEENAAGFGSEPFKMESMEQKISMLLEQPVQDAVLKPIVASGTTTGKTQSAKNISVNNDFRIVRKSLSTENKEGPPNEPSSHSESTSHSGSEEASSENNDHVDALDLSSDTKMDEFIVDNAWLSDQLPPNLLGSKKENLAGETANFEPKTNESESNGNQDEHGKSSAGGEIEKHLKPKENGFRTLNVKAKTTRCQGTETSAALYDSIMAFEDSEISAKSEVKNEEDPFAAFDGIHNYGPEESKADAATLKALQAEIAELEFNHPIDSDPIALPESSASISNEMQMIYDKDAMLGTDLKDLELEISNLSNTMHLKETEFLQQELAKLHENNSSSKSVNMDVFMEQSEQTEFGSLNSAESTEERTFQDELLKPLAESGTESQKQLEDNSNITESSDPKGENMQIKDTSTDKSDQEYLLYLDNNMLKPLKDQFYVKSDLTNAESFQLESQRLKHLEDSTNKFEEKQLPLELENVSQTDEVKLKEKNTESMFKEDQIVSKLSDLETSVGPLHPYAETFESEAEEEKLFEEKSLKKFINSANLEDVQQLEAIKLESEAEEELFEEKSLRKYINSTYFEDVQQVEAMNKSAKIPDDVKELEPIDGKAWDKLPDSKEATSVGPWQPYAETFESQTEKENLFEEKSLRQFINSTNLEHVQQLEAIKFESEAEEKLFEEKSLRQFINSTNLEDVLQLEAMDKSAKIHDYVEKLEPIEAKAWDKLPDAKETTLDTSVDPLQPYAETFDPPTEKENLFEEKSLRQFINSTNLEDVQQLEANDKSAKILDDVKKMEPMEVKASDKLPDAKEAQNQRLMADLKEDDELINRLRNYIDKETQPSKLEKDHGWDWLVNKVKIDDVDIIEDDRRKEFYSSEMDVSSSEDNKLQEAKEQLESRQAAIQMSQSSEESVLNEEKQLPSPVHEMKKRNVIAPGTPAAPVIKPAVPIHFTPTPAPQTKPLNPHKQQPIRKEMPITLNVSSGATDKVMKEEAANNDRPSDKWQENQERNRLESRKVRTQNLRVERKAALTKPAELDFENERKSYNPILKDAEVAHKSPYALKKTVPLAKNPVVATAEEPQLTARPPIKRKENHINRLGRKFQSIMRKGQVQEVDQKVSSKVTKTRSKSLDRTATELPQFPKLREGAGTSHRRKAPIRPPFLPPLNPRVRTPHPPFDARDHEYHTLARSYRTPDLSRLHSLPNMQGPRSSMVALAPKQQSKHLSTINLPKSSQTCSPSFQIPKGLLRSPSLAKIASAIHLGLLVSFLTRHKQSDK
ncbi:uncharacterized protein Gpdh3 [Drosophila tropicalis]|uniref:uncharacterized protein Gpdh3 n=1 Tax=Drosophila tropicalis TaxID=46794 RepID=UPI0035ABCC51